MNRRRQVLAALWGGGLSLTGLPSARAQVVRPQGLGNPAPALAPLGPLRIVIPGSEGGGWDQTGRALGAAIQTMGLAPKVTYENKGGKGGTLGLADFVDRYSADPNALLVGGMVMVGAIAVARPKVTLAQVAPVARLTSDYMVLATMSDSPLKDTKALIEAMKKDLSQVIFTGGSAGGVDHMLAAMIVRQLRLDVSALRYEPNPGGKEAVAMLASGKAQVAISGYSEFKPDLESHRLQALAVSSRRRLFNIPSLTEGGIATDLANWRGVFAPARISEDQLGQLRRVVARVTEAPAWRQTLSDRHWQPAALVGQDFADALVIEQAMAEAIAMILKLKAS